LSFSRQALEDLARTTLVEHGLLSVPVDPVVLASRLGVAVYNAKFSEDNLAALLSRRGDNVTILINESDPPYRKRFSIGHELGHHLLHLQGDGEVVDHTPDMFRVADPTLEQREPGWRQEVEANQFAAALLMPGDLVRNEWENNPSLPFLARMFNVSEEAMAIRLGVLGIS
jgi:Zn-dependent peptidase ImmA (M78 family)